MFAVLGPILTIAGLVDGAALNLDTGLAMIGFAAVMLFLGVRAQRRAVIPARDEALPRS
jgi:hypothetical protein